MVFISTPNSQTLSLNLDPKSTTLLSLQQSIRHHTQIPISQQHLLLPCSCNPLNKWMNPQSVLLSQLHITPYSTLTLHFPLLGGTRLNSKPPLNYVAALCSGATGSTDAGPAPDLRKAVDNRTDSTRKDGREARLQEKKKIEKYRAPNLKIRRRSPDLKRKVYTSSAQEWDSRPEVEDYSLRNKKKRSESSVPVRAKSRQESLSPGGTKTPWAQTHKKTMSSSPEPSPGLIAATRLRDEVLEMIQAANRFQKDSRREDVAKASFARALKSLLKSEKLRSLAVGGKGHEHKPDSNWSMEVFQEQRNVEHVRLLLHMVVDIFPLDLELWLALATWETYNEAKKVLDKAKGRFPKEPAIWITAARLDEANSSNSFAATIRTWMVIFEGIMALEGQGLVIDREAWMKEAEAAERAGSVSTCQAIIQNTIGIGVEGEDRMRTWVADAEECKKRGSIETARAIYAHALKMFPAEKIFWLEAAGLEKSHGTWESLDALLSKALFHRPLDEVLSLMDEEQRLLYGVLYKARAFSAKVHRALNFEHEKFELQCKNHDPEGGTLLAKTQKPRMKRWMASATVEREQGNTKEERKLLYEGLKEFPSFCRLWLMLGQLEERPGELENAKKVYESGLEYCPSCIPLWLSLANVEDKINGIAKARAVLMLARKNNPQRPELWLAAVRTELRHGHKKEADMLMERALEECPYSGALWAAAIEMVPWPERRIKIEEAYTTCGANAHVCAAKAKLYWHDNEVDKARSWLHKTVTNDPLTGEFWALYYKFELEHGTEEKQKDVLQRCVAAAPFLGEKWEAISNAVGNFLKSTETILKEVVVALSKEESEAAESGKS